VLEERPESTTSIKCHCHERWERTFRPTAPSFKTVAGYTDLFLISTSTDITCFRTVLENQIAGAVGRSESALANGGELRRFE
jgi:hypothetical protein